MAAERLQKILAQAGLASRRTAEEWIEEGLVTINGKKAQLGDRAEWGRDAIKVKGRLLTQKPEAPLYIAFYKPKAVISMFGDPERRASLADYFKKLKVRVFPVGRLDFNSEGLLFLTNDGVFAEKLQKREDIPRVYRVKVKGRVDDEKLARIERGGWVGVEGKRKKIRTHAVEVVEELTSKTVIQLAILGGGADLKALFDERGFLVEKVTRTAIGQIGLRGLVPGEFRYLKASQIEALFEQPELGMPVVQPRVKREPILPRPLSPRIHKPVK